MGIHEHVKIWRDTALSDLELLRATYVTHRFAPHTHESYVIGVIEQGAEQFEYRRSRYVAPAGSILFINPGEMHTGSSAAANGWTYRTLYPPVELLQRAASGLVGRQHGIPSFAEAVVSDPEMVVALTLTHRALEEEASALERESRLLWTLSGLLLRYADDHPRLGPLAKEQAGVQRVRRYLDENYAENISLEQLASLAQLSPFHLLRSFRDLVNLPPHAYQMQVRISRARQMLGMGVSCVETALAVGFADQSHFSRRFKRIVGVPPGLYGRAHQR